MTMNTTTSGDNITDYDYYYDYDYDYDDLYESADSIVLAVVNFTLSVLILFGNTLTIVAFCKFPELRIQPHFFVLNLAIADNIVGISACLVGFMFTNFSSPAFDESAYLCVFQHILVFISCSQSLVTLLAMALDRLVYVVYPYHHVRFFTERVIKIFMGIIWLLTVSAGILLAVYNTHNTEDGCTYHHVMPLAFDKFVLPVLILLVVVLTSACYAKIAFVAYKHKKAISAHMRLAQRVQKQQETPDETQRSAHPVGPDAANMQRSAVPRSQPTQQSKCDSNKSVSLFLTVYCLFAVCWTPWAVNSFFSELTYIYENISFSDLFIFLALSNSAMNALILACKNKQFARAYRTLLTRKSCGGCRNDGR